MQIDAIQAIDSSASHVADSGCLELTDLLNDVEALATLLLDEVRRAHSASTSIRRSEHVLDAFLLAAGMNQVTEDYERRRFPPLEALASRTKRRLPGAAPAFESLQGAIDAARRLTERRVEAWQQSLEQLVAMLAGSVADAAKWEDTIYSLTSSVVGDTRRLPAALKREILRLPDAFRAFDQQPDDCRRLTHEFAARWPERHRPLLVVGVRTSGSYLAPLQAAYLEMSGFREVSAMTFRPGQRCTRRDVKRIRELHDSNGLALLIDDPPVTGSKLAMTADHLERLGLRPRSIVLLVSLLGQGQVLPERLKSRQTVVLPWRRWAINDRMSDSCLQMTLSHNLTGRNVPLPLTNALLKVSAVEGIQPVELQPITDIKARPLVRSHLRAARRVLVRDAKGMRAAIDVYIKGTGLGYFGRHSLALSRKLHGLIPHVYGWSDGLLFRALLPESARLTSTMDYNTVTPIARYALSRSRALPALEDKSRRLYRRNATWDRLGDLLASGFGRFGPLATRLLKQYTRRVLQPAGAAVIDGSTALPHWFYEPSTSPPRVVKADFDERAFSSWELYSYDPVMDLAIAAADWEFRLGDQESTDFGDLLKAEYQGLTGEVISGERWFLYKLMHLLSAHFHFQRLLRDGPGHLQRRDGTPALSPGVQDPLFLEDLAANIEVGERALARVYNSYVAGLYIGDLSAPTEPVCSIAVEGLLESDWLKAGCLTSDGAMVLRSLILHGFRPRLITNRSLQELRSRCVIYRAAGGVARDGELMASDQLWKGQGEKCLHARAQVVALLGHPPGGCPLCRAPRLAPDAKVILTAIDAHHRRGLGRVLSVIQLAMAERAGRR